MPTPSLISFVSGGTFLQNNEKARSASLESARTVALAGLSLFGASCSTYETGDSTTLLSITGGIMGPTAIYLLARRFWPSSSKVVIPNIAPQTEPSEQPPNEAAAHYARAVEMEKRGDLDGAIEELTKAIELEPKNARYWMRRGSTKMEQGNPLEAIDDHTQAISLDENYAGAYFHRAVAYEALERVSEATEDYRETKKRGGHGGIGYYADRNLRALEQKSSAA